MSAMDSRERAVLLRLAAALVALLAGTAAILIAILLLRDMLG